MADILIATYPLAGHTLPLRPTARELASRGHRVRWYAGAAFARTVRATGAEHIPMRPTIDRDGRPLDEVHPDRARLTGLDKLRWDMKHLFIEPAIEQVAHLRRILGDDPADVIVVDPGFTGARMLSELDGLPWVSVGITPLMLPSRHLPPFGPGLLPNGSLAGRLRDRVLRAMTSRKLRDVVAYRDEVRARLGLPASGDDLMTGFLSPHLHLQASVPGLEYPRSDLPATVHFIGALHGPITSQPGQADAGWAEMDIEPDGRPLVHVTQGTLANDDLGRLLRPTIEALAGEDVRVLATLGSRRATHPDLDSLPSNAVVVPYASYDWLLPRTRVMVTNGGYGGVTQALAHGVPLVVAGAGEDKPEVAARVAWSGAGINLKTDRPTPARIRAAVREVLDTPSYATRARALEDEFARYDAPALVADSIENLLTEQAGQRPAA
ncbi:MAG TPA: nucleotide disphospho-sugar-binding domain-containing protein [Actinomycetes bacterium]